MHELFFIGYKGTFAFRLDIKCIIKNNVKNLKVFLLLQKYHDISLTSTKQLLLKVIEHFFAII